MNPRQAATTIAALRYWHHHFLWPDEASDPLKILRWMPKEYSSLFNSNCPPLTNFEVLALCDHLALPHAVWEVLDARNKIALWVRTPTEWDARQVLYAIQPLYPHAEFSEPASISDSQDALEAEPADIHHDFSRPLDARTIAAILDNVLSGGFVYDQGCVELRRLHTELTHQEPPSSERQAFEAYIQRERGKEYLAGVRLERHRREDASVEVYDDEFVQEAWEAWQARAAAATPPAFVSLAEYLAQRVGDGSLAKHEFPRYDWVVQNLRNAGYTI